MSATVKRFTERLHAAHVRKISIVARPSATPQAQGAISLRVQWAEETPPISLPLQRAGTVSEPY